MRQFILQPVVAGLGALGVLTWGAPAMAVSLLELSQKPSVVIPVMDEENEAVEEDLRPDDLPDTAEDKKPMMEPKMKESESSDADIEDEMIDTIGPGAE